MSLQREIPNSNPSSIQEIEWPLEDHIGPSQEINYEHLNELFKRKNIDFSASESFHGGPSSRGKGYKLAFWSWVASSIDLLILFSLSCIFLMTFSFLVNDSLKHISHVFGGSFLLIFVSVWLGFSALYMVMLRSFMGHSIGEWACGLRVGSAKQRLSRFYIFKVVMRVTLVFVTGVILLPVLSLLTGMDIAGKLTGIPLVSVTSSEK